MDFRDRLKLRAAGFAQVHGEECLFGKWSFAKKLTAYPVGEKGFWNLATKENDGTAQVHTFQKLEHLIDYSERFVCAVKTIKQEG